MLGDNRVCVFSALTSVGALFYLRKNTKEKEKMKKREFLALTICMVLVSFAFSAMAHSGGTDGMGGHRDNRNKSGLGSYHYHCGGYPAHLHNGGVCPYKNGGTSRTSSSSSKVNEIVAKSITIENKQKEIIIGEKFTLSVKIYPENTTYKNIEWEVDDESVISVDENDSFTALSVGKTTIRAIHKELTDGFEIEVKPVLAEIVDISCIDKDTGEEYEELRFKVGEELELSAFVLPKDTTDPTIEWSVDNSDVAKIDNNGKFTAIGKGTVIVTAETVNGITDTMKIEVYKTSWIIIFVICAVIIGAPVCLVVWLIKKRKK